MAIVWQTLSGNLGTIANGNVVSDTLIATTNQSFEVTYANTFTETISPNIYYTLIAGSLPTNLTFSNDSVNNQSTITGTATKSNTTGYKSFTVRATEYISEPNTTINDSNVTLTSADRSFSYWWIGPTPPITSNTTLTNVNIGSYYEYQLTVDNDATDVNWTLLDSIIHPNLSLLSNGLIRGYVSPTNLTSFTYNIQASNNIGSSFASYEIPVTPPNLSAIYNPFITTESDFLTRQRRNTYVYQVINGYDYNLDTITFNLDGELPGNLTLVNVPSANSCVISGIISNSGQGTIDYDFSLTPIKTNVSVYSGETKTFTITVLGDPDDTPIWTTSSNLGTIGSGEISELYVNVQTKSELQFTYELLDESNPLPPGLQLRSDGTITGKVTQDIPNGDEITFSFDIKATSIREIANRRFTLTVTSRTGKPNKNLYLRMMPKTEKRNSYYTVINNNGIIIPSYVYRPNDGWFGINKLRRILFASGLTPLDFSVFESVLRQNHYWKNLRLGEIKLAKSTNEQNEINYEIVYAELVDDNATSVSNPSTTINNQGTLWETNSLTIMYNKFKNDIGFGDTGIIPKWMLSRQDDGFVPGFKIVFPLVYLKPGYGAETLEKIKTKQRDLQSIEFIIDRYEFDGYRTSFPNPITLTPNTSANIDQSTSITIDSGQTVVNIADIIGKNTYTINGNFINIGGTNQTSIDLLDGMRLKFDYKVSNVDYRFNNFVVSGVGSSITLIPVSNQTITATADTPYLQGENTYFIGTNNQLEFTTNQIHIGDYIYANGYVVGEVKNIISATNIELTTNVNNTVASNIQNVEYYHTNWIPPKVPVDGDKYLIFPNIAIKEYNTNE